MKKLLLSAALIIGALNNSKAQSLNFDGVDDYLSVISTPQLSMTNAITIEAWVKTTGSPTGEQYIISKSDDSYYMALNVGGNVGSASFYLNGVSSGWLFSNATNITDNNWHHVASTYDGTIINIYIDGVLDNSVSASGTIQTGGNNVNFGCRNNTLFLQGSIDEARIWNVARTQTQIQNYMNCTALTSATGLVASYNFNDGVSNANNTTISSVNDVTGNGHTAALNNFTLTGAASNFTTDQRNNYLGLQSSIGSTSIADRMWNGYSIDYNNDGWNDIMVMAENSETRLFLNNGSGNFSSHTVLHAAGSGDIRAVADMDSDGDLDYVMTKAGVVTAYINNGNGTFSAYPTNLMNGTGHMISAKIADLNNDNKPDLILGNNNSTLPTDQNEIWLNTGTVGNPAFTFSVGYTNVIYKTYITTGDVDEDGDIDIFMCSASNFGTLFTNNNDGTFTETTAIPGYSGGCNLVDWNQDGHLDLLQYEGYNRCVMIRLGNGTGTFPAPTVLFQNTTINNGNFVDMNGDGFLDFVASNWGGNGYVYLNTGCAYVLQTGCNYSLGAADNNTTIADFNNDGTPDVFCQARDKKSSIFLNFLTPVTTPALPQITSANDLTICNGLNAELVATTPNSEIVKWYTVPTGGGAIYTGTNYTITTPTTGTYTYYVGAENSNGCVTASRIQVDLIVNPNPQITAASGNVNACGDVAADFGIVSPGANNTYQWFFDGVGFSDFGPCNGTYTEINFDTDTMTIQQLLTGNFNEYYVYCEVTNEFNCTTSSPNDTISVFNLPTVTASSSATTVCAGTEITLTGSGATTYAWSDGVSDGVAFPANSTHTYTVTGTDDNLCQNTATIDITVNTIPSVATTLTNETITATETGATYQWLDCNNSNAIITGETSQNFTATANGNYAVELNLNGCVDTSACVAINTVGIKSIVNNSGANIYPNPAKENITIETEMNSTISIVNVIGQTVIEVTSTNRSTKIDTSNLISGAYFVKIKTDKSTTITKLVIE